MRRWATRTSSCAAPSKASGRISRPMRNVMRAASLIFVALWIVSANAQTDRSVGRGSSPAAGAAKAAPDDTQEQLATVKTYCATCHNDRVKTAGVSFDG